MREPPAAALDATGEFDYAPPVLTGAVRPVTLVAYRDEFDFGLQQQPALALDTIPAFVERWRADAAAGVHDVAITRPEIAADPAVEILLPALQIDVHRIDVRQETRARRGAGR